MPNFEMTRISGVIAAMITLFDENENVDAGRTEAMVDFLLERGIDGFYLTGSTGEGFLMTGEERNLVVRTVIRRVAGRKPVIVHVGDIGTKKSIDLAKYAFEAGGRTPFPRFRRSTGNSARKTFSIITGTFLRPRRFPWLFITCLWRG